MLCIFFSLFENLHNSEEQFLFLARSPNVALVWHVSINLLGTLTFKAIIVSSLLGLQDKIVLQVLTSFSIHAACSTL